MTFSSSSTSWVRRLALARLFSITCSKAAFVALNYVVYQRTRSPTWLAAALLLTFGTTAVAAPAGGLFGDRFDRQKVMIGSDVIAATTFAAMALVDALWLLLLLAFVGAVLDVTFGAALAAAIPNLVPDERLTWANSTIEVASQAGFLVGPLVGGALLPAVGASGLFVANASTFLASAALCLSVTGRFSGDRGHQDRGDALDGLRFLLRDRVLTAVAAIYLGIDLGIGMTMVANVPLADSLGVGSFGYGALIAVWGAGSVLGAFAARTLRPAAEPPAFLGGCVLVGSAAVLVGVSPWFFGVLTSLGAMGVGDGVSAVASIGMVQRLVPDHIRSRVVGELASIVAVGLVASYFVAGPVVSLVGPRAAYLIGGLVSLAPMPFFASAFRRTPVD